MAIAKKQNSSLTRLLGLLMVLKGVISLLQNPGSTLSIYDIEDGLRYGKASELSLKYLKSKPEVLRIIQERYLAARYELKDLESYPVGSLAHAYASYLKDLGLQTDFYPTLKVEDDTSYIFLRRRQTHDIWHIVTGFSIDLPGELALKAFEIAQMQNSMSVIILVGGVTRTLFRAPERLSYTFRQIVTGYIMGLKAKPLLAEKWEQNWHKSLLEWREELGIVVSENTEIQSSLPEKFKVASQEIKIKVY